MSAFHYQNGLLYAENLPLENVAKKYGTPLYVYAQSHIERQLESLRSAFAKELPKQPLVAFACKANTNHEILKLLASHDAGCDTVSWGEIARAVKAGIPADKIVFSGVGKGRDELTNAIKLGIKQINVESAEEFTMLAQITEHLRKSVNIAFRMNPDVDAKTHAKITTGKSENKFGFAFEDIIPLYRIAVSHDYLDPAGLSMHIGSQLLDMAPFEKAFQKMAEAAHQLKSESLPLTTLDIGGGLGVRYKDEERPSPERYAVLVKKYISPLVDEIICEPGRFLLAESGLLLSRVIIAKKGREKDFLILDAGMNDLLRPTLYDAYHHIQPVSKDPDQNNLKPYDVVGPVCETGDTFGKSRMLSELQEGDLVAIMGAGAYGFAMANEYNSRPLPAEVLVKGNTSRLIRQRRSIDDMIKDDIVSETEPDED